MAIFTRALNFTGCCKYEKKPEQLCFRTIFLYLKIFMKKDQIAFALFFINVDRLASTDAHLLQEDQCNLSFHRSR